MKRKKIFLALLVYPWLFLVGCQVRTRTVTLERIKTEWRDRVVRDSVLIHDSIYVQEKIRGDTVYREREVWRSRERKVHDTIRLYRTDTIPVPVEVVREVPRPFFQELRRSALLLCVVPIVFAAVILALRKWRRR